MTSSNLNIIIGNSNSKTLQSYKKKLLNTNNLLIFLYLCPRDIDLKYGIVGKKQTYMKRIINLILLAFVSLNSLAVSSYDEKDVKRLKAEMLRLISTAEIEKFYEVSNKLKDVCQKIGDERTFYTAWGNQADYESTRQNYAKADEIAEQIASYAAEQNSHWGY